MVEDIEKLGPELKIEPVRKIELATNRQIQLM
jgi:hypothetical protein